MNSALSTDWDLAEVGWEMDWKSGSAPAGIVVVDDLLLDHHTGNRFDGDTFPPSEKTSERCKCQRQHQGRLTCPLASELKACSASAQT